MCGVRGALYKIQGANSPRFVSNQGLPLYTQRPGSKRFQTGVGALEWHLLMVIEAEAGRDGGTRGPAVHPESGAGLPWDHTTQWEGEPRAGRHTSAVLTVDQHQTATTLRYVYGTDSVWNSNSSVKCICPNPTYFTIIRLSKHKFGSNFFGMFANNKDN